MSTRNALIHALAPVFLAGFLAWENHALSSAATHLDDLELRLAELEITAATPVPSTKTPFIPFSGAALPSDDDTPFHPGIDGREPAGPDSPPPNTIEERIEQHRKMMEQRKDERFDEWADTLFDALQEYGKDNDIPAATMDEIETIFDDMTATGRDIREAVDRHEQDPASARQEMREYRQEVQETLIEMLGEEGMQDLEAYLRDVEPSPMSP